MGVKKTTEIFKQEVYEAEGNNYKVLGDYVNGKVKIKMKHLECGYEYEVTPHSFLAGNRCPGCRYKRVSSKTRKSFDTFNKEVEELGKGEYKVEPPYKGSKLKMKFTHLTCGNTFMMEPNSFIQGNRCPYERGERIAKSKRKSTEQFKDEVDACYGEGHYELLEDYKGADIPVKVKHNECGNIYDTRPADFVRGHGCPECAYKTRAKKVGDAHRDPLEKVIKEINTLLGMNYLVITKPDDYQGNRQKISIKHLPCGTIYTARFSDIQSKNGGHCPACFNNTNKASYGEIYVNRYLKNTLRLIEGKDYKYGYFIPNLVYKKSLHFDFYLPKFKIAIEYDGGQHYFPVALYGGIEQFKLIKMRDYLKDKYCIDNNILLFRIPYFVNSQPKITSYLNNALSYTSLFKDKEH